MLWPRCIIAPGCLIAAAPAATLPPPLCWRSHAHPAAMLTRGRIACRYAPAMASASRRRGALVLLALPVVAMMGLFAWSGSVSAQAAQGAGSPIGIARAFVNDINSGDCTSAIALIGSSPLHRTLPSCQGFSNAVSLSGCSYQLGTPPPAPYAARVSGYGDLSAVDVTCSARSSTGSSGLAVPMHLEIVTAVSAAGAALRIVDFREVPG